MRDPLNVFRSDGKASLEQRVRLGAEDQRLSGAWSSSPPDVLLDQRREIGLVWAGRTDQTRGVVERRVAHPAYGKIIKRSKKYHAHDEANQFREGETVRIEECKPISKLKSWTVIGRVGADAPSAA